MVVAWSGWSVLMPIVNVNDAPFTSGVTAEKASKGDAQGQKRRVTKNKQQLSSIDDQRETEAN